MAGACCIPLVPSGRSGDYVTMIYLLCCIPLSLSRSSISICILYSVVLDRYYSVEALFTIPYTYTAGKRDAIGAPGTGQMRNGSALNPRSPMCCVACSHVTCVDIETVGTAIAAGVLRILCGLRAL